MENMAAALIGVLGTLLGTLLGWILNSQTYKMGKTRIYATLDQRIEIPLVFSEEKGRPQQKKPASEYFFRCTASNSRQIPVILENFYIEMRRNPQEKPIRLPVKKDAKEHFETNGVKFEVELALPRQMIPPHTLYEFSFKIDSQGYSNEDIEYSRIVLFASDEKHKKHTFLLFNGWKLERPPERR